MAVAVEADNFRQYFPVGMQAAQQGITLGDEALSEYSYVFFANATKVMKLEMLPYLATLVPHLHTIIEESELTKTLADGEDDDDEEYVPPTAAGAAAGAEEGGCAGSVAGAGAAAPLDDARAAVPERRR